MAARRKRKIKKRTFVEIPEGACRALAAAAALWACFWWVGLTNACPEPASAYYAIALEWFCLFLLPAGIGLSGAVSSMIALRLERGSVGSARRVVSTSLLAGTAGGLVLGLILFACSGFLMGSVLQTSDAAFVLRGFAPALPFLFSLLVLVGGIDGFGGTRALFAVKIVFFLCVAATGAAIAGRMSEYGQKVGALLQNDQYGPAYGALGGGLSIGLAAVAACLIALIAWWRMRPGLSSLQWEEERMEKRGQLLAGLIKKLLPVLTVTTLLVAGMLGQCLLFFRVSPESSQRTQADLLSDWAIYTGRARALLLIPLIGAVAFAARMAPELKIGFVRRNLKKSRDKCMIALRCAAVFAAPFTVIAAVLARPLLSAFFREGDVTAGAALLQAGSACILFYGLAAMLGSILLSADKPGLLTGGVLAAISIHLVALYGMLVLMNGSVLAVVYAHLLLSVLLCAVLAAMVQKNLRLRLNWIRILLAPSLSGGIMAAVCSFFAFLVLRAASSPVAVGISVLAGLLFYFVCIIALKGVRQRELRSFPAGGFFLALAKLVRLM